MDSSLILWLPVLPYVLLVRYFFIIAGLLVIIAIIFVLSRRKKRKLTRGIFAFLLLGLAFIALHYLPGYYQNKRNAEVVENSRRVLESNSLQPYIPSYLPKGFTLTSLVVTETLNAKQKKVTLVGWTKNKINIPVTFWEEKEGPRTTTSVRCPHDILDPEMRTKRRNTKTPNVQGDGWCILTVTESGRVVYAKLDEAVPNVVVQLDKTRLTIKHGGILPLEELVKFVDSFTLQKPSEIKFSMPPSSK